MKMFTRLLATLCLFAGSSHAALMYDQDISPDVIFGSGVTNGGWTVDLGNGIELGLRAKLRFNSSNNPENVFNSNNDGTYSFDNIAPPSGFGFASPSDLPNSAIWNFEWSVNVSNVSTDASLDSFIYLLEIDFDPTSGTEFFAFDPIAVPNSDHALGGPATGQGGGVKSRTDYTSNLASGDFSVAQNSWNMLFFNASFGTPFLNTDNGTYDFRLSAFNQNGDTLSSTQIQVIQGDGGTTAVSEPSMAVLMLLGVAGLVARRRKSA